MHARSSVAIWLAGLATAFSLLLLASRPAEAALSLAGEVNPDPAEPLELVDVQIGVSSTSATGALTLRVLWPAGLEAAPYVAGGGSCSGGCSVGEYLIWNLGTLGAGENVTVSVNPNVLGNVASGTVIPLAVELLEANVLQLSLALEVEVQAASPLELAIDPLADPVLPNGTLAYEIVFGNAGAAAATGVTLDFPLPDGTAFVEATGGGLFAAGEVSWNLGDLPANSGGRVRVLVDVDPLAEGSLLLVDAAVLSGTVSALPQAARATALSRVATEALHLGLEVYPDPVAPGQLLDAQIVISNPSLSTTSALTLRALRPEEFEPSFYVAGGGVCSGGCDEGEYVNWSLGTLGPGASVVASINPNVLGNVVNGALVPIEVELLEVGRAARTVSHTAIVQLDSPLEVAVDPLADPAAPGQPLEYEIVYGNAGAANATNALLVAPVPAGTTFVSATGGGVHANGEVSWNLGTLAANTGGQQRLTVLVDSLAEGSLLDLNAAVLSGTVNFQAKQALSMAVSRVATEALQMGLEVYPDPVAPGQLLDAQVMISNPSLSATGALTLRVLWSEEFEASPYHSGGATCSGGCDAGEYVNWNLGVLGPGASIGIGINPNVLGTVANGALVPLEVELLETGLAARTVSHTVVTQLDSPLEVAVDPLADPATPSQPLEYEIVYGNAGAANATNVTLAAPVPAGTTFVSATGGGVHANGRVSWNLGTLAANTGGQQRFTVLLDALAEGSLLDLNAATLSGTVNFQARQARTMAVSRVATESLEMTLEVNPDPVGPGQLLDAQIVISNPSLSTTGTLTLRAWRPEEFESAFYVAGGGVCSGGCDEGEYVNWNLGVLGPGASIVASINPNVLGSVANGALVPLEVELLESGLAARTASHTAVTQLDSPLEITLDPRTDPVAVDGNLVYDVTFGNSANAVSADSVLTFPLPADAEFVSASDGGVFAGGRVSWALGNLPALTGGRRTLTLDLDGLPAGRLLDVNAAAITGTVSGQAKWSRAMAASRISAQQLQLGLDVVTNPSLANAALAMDVTISNPTLNPTGSLVLRVLWPEELSSAPVVTGGGFCSGGCDQGEYITWNIGVLGASSNVLIEVNAFVLSSVAHGRLVPLEFEVLEASLAARNHSETVLIGTFTDTDGDGEPDAFDEDDDNDGMPDWWETLHGLNPLNAGDADDDPDADGVNNLQEFLDGTNPGVNNQIIFKDSFES